MTAKNDMRDWLREELEQAGHGSRQRLAKYLGFARPDAITRMLNSEPGKETREIKARELELMRQFFADEAVKREERQKTFSTFDPDAPESRIDPDAPLTHGSETGASIPQGTSPQLDVTAGMGAGGFVLTSEGVPGKFGMTFAADHIAGYWQLPDQVLTSLSLRARDTVIIPVQGNSMAPTLIEGDFVFIDTRHRWPSPDGVYALADEFGGIIVKTLRLSEQRGDEGPYIDIVSDNPDRERYPVKTRPADDLRIIGRVVRRFSAVF